VELFGSFANTFTIANSDIDCCVTDPTATSDELQSSGLPDKLQAHLNALGGFETTLLTQTRIPILKLFRPATSSATTPAYKYPLHCDVGWQNRLALHNTRLLRAYSAIDPRLRQIVLFVKYWTKTRVISRPRYGTLCSYGYVLMIIYFLTNVVQPAVLPNLQCLPRQGKVRIEEVECEGCDISFSDGRGWKSENTQVPYTSLPSPALPPLARAVVLTMFVVLWLCWVD
jgi:terminal uridylyltransferase